MGCLSLDESMQYLDEDTTAKERRNKPINGLSKASLEESYQISLIHNSRNHEGKDDRREWRNKIQGPSPNYGEETFLLAVSAFGTVLR